MSNILNNTTSLQEVLEALQTKAAGSSSSGGLYNTEINNLLAVAPFLTKAYYSIPDDSSEIYYGGAIELYAGNYDRCLIFPPWITEVDECFADVATNDADTCAAIFLSKTPPTIGWQGAWASDGGNWPPKAIYVPDESIDAYKATTNLAEFADAIKPLSEYSGEGYYGGT